jgi:hypothetical protein
MNPTCATRPCVPTGAFYALAPNRAVRDSGSSCALRLLRTPIEFRCVGSSARWDRLGYAVGANRDPPLSLILLKIDAEGKLVASPAVFGRVASSAEQRQARELWPRWHGA